ncbi:MAG: hypothetical protein AAGD06_03555 [Acidobacteriota bacterium]
MNPRRPADAQRVRDRGAAAPGLVANLDAEERWARLLDPSRPRPALPRRVLAALASAAEAMRILGTATSPLWSPGDGPIPAPAPGTVYWAQTEPLGPRLPTTRGARARGTWAPGKRAAAPPTGAPLRLLAASAPAHDPRTAARVNHRRFGLELGRRLGLAPDGATFVGSLAEVDDAARRAPGPWVVKACLSAAGRSRYVHRPAADPHGVKGARRRVERLLRHHGPLLYEPWEDRTDDFGVVLWVGADDHRVAALHRQGVDREGRFLGPDSIRDAGAALSESDRRRLHRVAGWVADGLRGAGYLGPAGLDAWRHRTEHGLELRPFGEINARFTFGWLAAVHREVNEETRPGHDGGGLPNVSGRPRFRPVDGR